MNEFFDEDYFCGNKKSNYVCYEEIDSRKYFKSIINFLEGQGRGGRYLDVGCAFGLLIREVAWLFDESFGCDISSYAIEKARINVPGCELRLLDIEEDFPYPKEHFDVITALDVLEHTSSLAGNFEKISMCVKDKGYFILSLPVRDWPRKAFGFLDKDKSHISIPDEREILCLAEKCGFEVLKREHFAPMPWLGRMPGIPAEVQLFLQKNESTTAS